MPHLTFTVMRLCGKFEELTSRGVIYVTKMKKNLVYQIDEDTAYMTPEGLMAW